MTKQSKQPVGRKSGTTMPQNNRWEASESYDLIIGTTSRVTEILQRIKVLPEEINDETAIELLRRVLTNEHFGEMLFNNVHNKPDRESILFDYYSKIADSIRYQNITERFFVPLEEKADSSAPQSTTPRPDLPRWAEENRPTKMVRIRLEPGLVEEMDKAANGQNRTRTSIIDSALRANT